jgi:uncharacterized protein
MSVTLPESVDAGRMVTARRCFQGSMPIAGLRRLGEVLASDAGTLQYELEFGRDEFGIAWLAVHVEAPLTLICQRTLEPFVLPVTVDTRLGLIGEESEEAALLPGYEPLLVTDDRLHPAAVIEDELLLAVPLVPVSPQSEWSEEGREVAAQDASQETIVEDPAENPFAVLRELKTQVKSGD